MLIIPARAIADPNLLGRGFPPTPEGRDSWMRWRAVLKAMSGEPLNLLERSLFRAVAGRREEPARPVKFAWVIVGRRSARRQSAPRSPAPRRWATIASTCALAKRQRSSVWPMASNRPSSPSIISAAHSTPIRCWRRWWRGEYSLELNTEIEILVLANNYRSIRGRSILVAILDECCFWRSEESATPDIETYTALVPSLVTLPNSMLIGISSAYRKSGLMFEQYKQYFGVNDPDTLVIKDATREFNSTVPESFIQQELDRDPEAAAAEWLSEFRADLADYIQREVIEDAVDSDCRERPYHSGLRYVGFIDPSSGSGDSMTLAIAHKESGPDGQLVLDYVRERAPPFSPEDVVEEFCDTLKSYRIGRVTGDRYAGEWPREQFRKRNIAYQLSERPKTDIYRECLPLFNSAELDCSTTRVW